MSDRAMLLRVRSRRTPYRRGGIEFGNLPLVLGPEHFEEGLAGLRAVVAIITDPVLTVKRSTREGEDGDFVALDPREIAEMVEELAVLERVASLDAARDDVADKVADLIGDGAQPEPPAIDPELAGVGLLTTGGDIKKLQSPEGPDANGDDAAAPSPAADGKADGGADAAPAVEIPPASDASAAPGEQSRAGADASGAAPAAGADAGNQPEGTQQPPVAEADTRNEPEKGAAVPAEAKAKAVAKPRGSSGRKPSAAASAKG